MNHLLFALRNSAAVVASLAFALHGIACGSGSAPLVPAPEQSASIANPTVDPNDPCSAHRFGSCPKGCVEECVGSCPGCDDCGGPGSCRAAPASPPPLPETPGGEAPQVDPSNPAPAPEPTKPGSAPALPRPDRSPVPPPKKLQPGERCQDFTFSTCPRGCKQQCISTCAACTNCGDGPGSCVKPD